MLSRTLSPGGAGRPRALGRLRAGALLESDYLNRLVAAGFNNVRVDSRGKIGEKPWYSATISAFKPSPCC